MNIAELRTMVQVSESFYEHIDKSSLHELTEFLATFQNVYAIFQKRSQHVNLLSPVSAELNAFYLANEAELTCLSRKVITLADSIENEMSKFRTKENNYSLLPHFFKHAQSKKAGAQESKNMEKEGEAKANDGLSFMGGKKGFL